MKSSRVRPVWKWKVVGSFQQNSRRVWGERGQQQQQSQINGMTYDSRGAELCAHKSIHLKSLCSQQHTDGNGKQSNDSNCSNIVFRRHEKSDLEIFDV